MKPLFSVLILAVCLSIGVVAVAQDGADMNEKQKTSYSVGVQFGNMLGNTPDLIDEEALMKGLHDSLAGEDLQVTQEEMQQALMSVQAKIQEAQQKKMEEQYAGNKEKGETYLAEHAEEKGVKVLPSGLQYKVIEPGTGRTPKRTDRVSTHYRGTFIDGSEFDSSYKRGEPAEFGVTQVIPGWTEALTLMKEGAKWELAIPYQLAYGEAGRPPAIPPYSVLKFEIELLKIVDTP
jgi:FKBP-type peptidyl-prolyl cis-trans isomerase FklB